MDKKKTAVILIVAVLIAGVLAYYFFFREDNGGGDDEEEEINRGPTAEISGDPYMTVKPGKVISLNASGSSDPDGDPMRYMWDLDDEVDNNEDGVTDNDNDEQGESIEYVAPLITETKTYRITLTVSDIIPGQPDKEKSDKDTVSITVRTGENKTDPEIEMSCRYGSPPPEVPFIGPGFIVTVESVNVVEMLQNYTYILEDPTGDVLFNGTLNALKAKKMPGETMYFFDIAEPFYLSEGDYFAIKEENGVAEGGVLSLYYFRDPVGQIELVKQ